MVDLNVQTVNSFVSLQVSNRGISKLFPNVRVLSEHTPDRMGIVQVGQLLSDVKIKAKNGPMGVPSLPEFVGIDYIGYIIEKERLDKSTGQWNRIDEYRILGAASNNFKDSRVAFGNVYRYRIKSILKVTSKISVAVNQLEDLNEDLRETESKEIQDAISAQENIIASVEKITNVGLKSLSSKGHQSSLLELVSGLSVKSDEKETSLVSVPVSANNDVLKNFKNTSNLAVSSLDLMKGTVDQSTLKKLTENSVSKVLEFKDEYVSYYFESLPSRKWMYVHVNESLPPPPPSSIKIVPNSELQRILITWLSPPNSQRDTKKFKLYRRERLGQKWTLLKEFNNRENFYLDTSVRFFHKYIYALTTIDTHGIESVLSMQIQCELNPSYKLEKKEKLLKWISGSGANPKTGFNEIFKKFFQQEVPIIAENNLVIGPTTTFKDTQKKLVIRVKSLDIHETKEFVVTLKNLKIK